MEEDVRVNTITSDTGRFVIEGIPPPYRLGVNAQMHGYIMQYYDSTQVWENADMFTVRGTDMVEGVVFELILGGTVTGRVVDADTGTPIADAWIEALTTQGDRRSETNTDSDGWYTLGGIPSGSYRIKAQADRWGYIQRYYGGGRSSRSADLVTVTGAETINGIDIAMIRGAAISGRITDAATGNPIVGMDLSAGPRDGDHMAWDSTNGDGAFVLSGLPDGVIEVTASGQGYLEVRKTVTIVAGEDIENFNF